MERFKAEADFLAIFVNGWNASSSADGFRIAIDNRTDLSGSGVRATATVTRPDASGKSMEIVFDAIREDDGTFTVWGLGDKLVGLGVLYGPAGAFAEGRLRTSPYPSATQHVAGQWGRIHAA